MFGNFLFPSLSFTCDRIWTESNLCVILIVVSPKMPFLSAVIVLTCVSPLYQYTVAMDQHVVGVNMDSQWCCCRCTDSTFLEHGHPQVLFTLRLSAAHDRLSLALLCAGVTHCQDLDLTIVLLGSQAIHPCWATNPQEQSKSGVVVAIKI